MMDHESQKPIDLKVGTTRDDHDSLYPVEDHQTVSQNPPVMGWFAVGCGVLGLFTLSIIFVPLALIFSMIAIIMGQFIWALAGILLAIIGFITSPQLLLLVGLSVLASYFGL